MRPRLFALAALIAAAPGAAQIPINGAGNAGGGRSAAMQRWLGRADDRPDRVHSRQRSAELGGQIRQLRDRIDDLRESGQISRAEARSMRRETRRAALYHTLYGGNGLSDSEAAELQSRIYVAGSLVRPSRLPTGR
ncbi:MAG TPA: hypothetical protein VLK25_06520 [Allosphingosinicella sp.]|nr:hypothetical protein [Allosphingosinicella sp.]